MLLSMYFNLIFPVSGLMQRVVIIFLDDLLFILTPLFRGEIFLNCFFFSWRNHVIIFF